jgi:sialate O-acetylesterase
MQYTPRSMAGMNNLSAELLAADGYAASMRFFTVGMDTSCAGAACSKAFSQLNPVYRTAHACNNSGKSCRELWEPASAAALGRTPAWNTFSAVCFLTGRAIHDALGGGVPVGLVSSNWGGTKVEVWQPPESIKDCPGKGAGHGTLWNSMVAPFAVGPMALKGFTWCE